MNRYILYFFNFLLLLVLSWYEFSDYWFKAKDIYVQYFPQLSQYKTVTPVAKSWPPAEVFEQPPIAEVDPPLQATRELPLAIQQASLLPAPQVTRFASITLPTEVANLFVYRLEVAQVTTEVPDTTTTLVAPNEAAYELTPGGEPYTPSTQKETQPGNRWPTPKRVYVNHIEGVGDQASFSYGTDYTTLGVLFAPDYRLGEFMYMIDVKGHRFDNDAYAVNLGIGGRYIPAADSFCQLLGVNAYYDWREGILSNYQQIGFGLEILSARWDIRANAYVPVGAAKKLNIYEFNYPGGYQISGSDCEFASYGFNAEAGWTAVRGKSFLLYFATGPYYLTRSVPCCDSMRGFEFRVRPQYKDYLAVEAKVSWDSVYKWIYQTEFMISLPFYQITKRKDSQRPCKMDDRQVYQPVERFNVMPLGRKECWRQNF